MAKTTKQNSQTRQITRFGLVGVLNFVIDFAIFNILSGPLAVGVVIAGVISGTIAMINSFIFNQRFTFRSRHTSTQQIVYFFAITIFGLYVIRPLITHFLTVTWLGPAHFAFRVSHALHLPFGDDFVRRNLALLVAVLIVLFYNYFTYKKFVFVDEHKSKK